LLDGKTSVPTYRPAKPETIERSSNVTTKSVVVRLGKRPVIQGHLAAKARSSERIAANSKTRERYESEITIAIHARGREAGNTDLMPIAAAIEVMASRMKSFLVSLLTVDFTIGPRLLPSSSADPLATMSLFRFRAETRCLCLCLGNKACERHH